MIPQKASDWLKHAGFWIAYLLFKVYHEFVWVFPKYQGIESGTVVLEAVIAQFLMLPIKILFTYGVAYKLLPSALGIYRKWTAFFMFLAVTLVAYRLNAVHIAIPIAYHAFPASQPVFSLALISSGLIDILFVAGLGIALILYQRNILERKRTQLLEKEKIAAELRFLKQQTNPHFLLNTLNSLYALARKNAPQTSEAIMQLSKLLRFVLYESNAPTIPLTKEIEIIQDYINLEKLRFGKRLQVTLEIQEGISGNISPLLLLTLVENALKHGVEEIEEDPFVIIRLLGENQQLRFSVQNKAKEPNLSTNDGIGLKNLRKQLTLQYPEHRLFARKEGELFIAELILPLTHEKD